jgi:hypothetical protein
LGQAGNLEPLTVGRGQLAKLLSVHESTLDRWDQLGILGPVGVKKSGRKLWSLDEIRQWVASGMPCRDKWQAIRELKKGGIPGPATRLPR